MQDPNKNRDRIERLKNGDPKALESFFLDYFKPLLHFARALIRDKCESEDIVVTTILKLWKLRTNFDTEQNIKAFLYISVRNACLNYLHKVKKCRNAYKAIHYLEGPLTDTDLVRMPDPRIIGKEILIQLLNDAIAKLPPTMKAILESMMEGHSNKQISQKMKISEATIRVHKARAIKMIKMRLFGGA